MAIKSQERVDSQSNVERLARIETDLEYLKQSDKTFLEMLKSIQKTITESLSRQDKKLDDSHAKQTNAYIELNNQLRDMNTAITQNFVKKDDDDWFLVKHDKAHEKRLEKGKNWLNIILIVLGALASMGIGMSIKVFFLNA